MNRINHAEIAVSVVVPCYNQGEYLEECLKSVIDQSYTIWECIIVNDGSTDNTETIAHKWCELDPRFKYVSKANGGLSSARNTGIKANNGKYVLPLDADDRIGVHYMTKALGVFKDQPKTDLVYCNAEYFDGRTGSWSLPEYSYSSLLLRNLIFCSCFYSREKAIDIGLYDETLKSGLEDWEFLLRLLNKDSAVVKLGDVLFYYRYKEQSMLRALSRDELQQLSVKEKIYKQHASELIKYHKDWINLIRENRELNDEILNLSANLDRFNNSVPKRNLKNLVKFLLGRKLIS